MENIVIILLLLGIVISFLVGGVVYFYFRNKTKLSSFEIKNIQQRWQEIMKKKSSSPAEAIIQADKLLDYVMSKLGKKGTMGEKLKKHGEMFSNINDVWYAHKIRNKIAHEMNFVVYSKTLDKCLRYFKIALNDLGINL